MMHSEFYNVALDRLRYSLVWEDSATLFEALDIQPHDRVLVITSAGCNALNVLLKNPRQAVAVDLNPLQNKLLCLKMHVIRHHDHSVLRGLLGLDGPDSVVEAVAKVLTTLPTNEQEYWATFFDSHPNGILTAGKLEAYITDFVDTLNAETRLKLRRLISFDTVAAQGQFFTDHLHESAFKAQFIQYFDAANLSKGRDPRLFTYAQESGGAAFYDRLCRQLATTVVQHNFFFRFFFFGPCHLPESVLPPCYQAQNYGQLRANLDRLTLIDGEAVDYLLSAEGFSVTKASLSNIFEYTSQDEFGRVCALLFSPVRRSLRFVFWNLLQQQGNTLSEVQNLVVSTQPITDTACFYFRDVRVIETCI